MDALPGRFEPPSGTAAESLGARALAAHQSVALVWCIADGAWRDARADLEEKCINISAASMESIAR
jgi:hypothetical protein